MNKKSLMLTITLLAIAMLTTPMVQAVPGAAKNNDKFQTWHYEKVVNYIDVGSDACNQWIPSIDKVNKFVSSFTTGYVSFTITVGTNTYTQGVDFDCVDTFTDSYFIEPEFYLDDPTTGFVVASHKSGLRVHITFDFSAYPGGIEGTLHILEVGNGAAHYTNSLEGTGDLQNVQVKGVWTGDFTTFPIVTIFNDGTVIGWP